MRSAGCGPPSATRPGRSDHAGRPHGCRSPPRSGTARAWDPRCGCADGTGISHRLRPRPDDPETFLYSLANLCGQRRIALCGGTGTDAVPPTTATAVTPVPATAPPKMEY